MSVDYASGLSHYDDLGVCGLDEVYDKIETVKEKVKLLASWLRHYDGSCVAHVGAGLSTSAGIPDFRGKSGVWTKLLHGDAQEELVSSTKDVVVKDEKDLKQVNDIKPFDKTEPTLAHLVLKELCNRKFIRHIVSQNVDGLFLKSNILRKFISELHGDFYLDECTRCRSRFIRNTASKTMRLQKSSIPCRKPSCKGYLRDTILDWESPIPYNELRVAQRESKLGKLHICIGSTMQLRPAKDLVSPTKNHRLVMINLQPTQFDKRADLVINYYADDVMRMLAQELDLNMPTYDPQEDPTKRMPGVMWTKT